MTTYRTANRLITRKLTLLTLTLVLFPFFAVFAQNYSSTFDPERDYKEGLRLFNEKRYGSAQQYFDRLSDREKRVGFNDISSDAEYFAAICAIELHNKDAAARILRYIENHPGSPRIMMAHFQMGRHLYRLKDYTGASKWFDKVTRQDLTRDQLSEFFFKKGYCAYMSQNMVVANRMFYELLDMPKSDFYEPALYYYSHLEYEKKNYQTALQGFEKLTTSQAFGSLMPYYIAQVYFLQRRFQNVINYVPQHISKVVPARVPEMKRIVGESHFRLEKYDSAIHYLEQYKEIAESFERYDIYQLGYAYYKTGNFEQATKNFSLATNTPDSLSQNAYYHLGDCYLKMNDKKNAHLAFGNAWRMEFFKDIQEDALFNYAKLTYELSYAPFNETIRNFEAYLEKFPQSPRRNEIYDYLVKVYLTGRNYKEALASLERIKDSNRVLDNARQRTMFYYGIELFTNLNFTEAETLLRKSIATKGDDHKMRAMAAYWLAEAYNRQNKHPEALNSYNQFLTTPGAYNTREYRLANYNMGYIHFKQRNYNESIRWFNLFVDRPIDDTRFTVDAHLRIGDCFFAQRQFQRGIDSYEKAFVTSNRTNEYARYQKGISYGLINMQREKIETLEYFFSNNTSIYADLAIFEIAKAYNRLEDNEKAIEAYQYIVYSYPNSLLNIRSQLQSGLMAFNIGQNQKAIDYLKRVVEKQPNGPEASEAMATLKNVYVEMNDVDGYFTYAKTVNRDISTSEQDSLTFRAAEKSYMNNDCNKAISLLTDYSAKFPRGQFVSSAEFYKGMCAMRLKDTTLAISSFGKVAELQRSIYSVLAVNQVSQLNFKKGNYTDALKNYQQLLTIADAEEMLREAKIGIMRCYVRLGDWQNTIASVVNVLALPGIPQETQIEATYSRATANFSMENFDKAFEDYKLLEANTRIPEGAEARYRIAYILHRKGQAAEAEKVIFDFIKASTPHYTWLGNSFLLLATIFKEKGDNFQAKAYLKSLLDNYPNNDDGIKTAAADSLEMIMSLENKPFENQGQEVTIDMEKK
jgi:tetratricopeptide (TPR) repeat protein